MTSEKISLCDCSKEKNHVLAAVTGCGRVRAYRKEIYYAKHQRPAGREQCAGNRV